MTENPKQQLNVRLDADLISRLRRVKDRHTLRPSWDALIETLVTGEQTLVGLEAEVKKRGK